MQVFVTLCIFQLLACRIVSLGFDFQSQIIAEILEIIFGDDTVLVQIPGQLERADHPLAIDTRNTCWWKIPNMYVSIIWRCLSGWTNSGRILACLCQI